jgi:hypothetical protein
MLETPRTDIAPVRTMTYLWNILILIFSGAGRTDQASGGCSKGKMIRTFWEGISIIAAVS